MVWANPQPPQPLRNAPACRSPCWFPSRSRETVAKAPPSSGRGSPWRRSRRRRSRGRGRRRRPPARQGQGRPGGCRWPSTSASAGRAGEGGDGAAHGEEARLQDVHRLDLGDAGDADADARGQADLGGELFAALGGEQLAVVRPSGIAAGSRMTAAATTGPAQGPRPTSSMPQTGCGPALSRLKSGACGRSSGTLIRPVGGAARIAGIADTSRWLEAIRARRGSPGNR